MEILRGFEELDGMCKNSLVIFFMRCCHRLRNFSFLIHSRPSRAHTPSPTRSRTLLGICAFSIHHKSFARHCVLMGTLLQTRRMHALTVCSRRDDAKNALTLELLCDGKNYDCITMDDGCNILLMDFITNNVSR